MKGAYEWVKAKLNIRSVVRRACEHENTKELFRCYQDRYYKDECLDCGEIIYKGMD